MVSDNTILASSSMPSTPPASASSPGNMHSFFASFPRELRDEIYDQIIREEEEVFKGACFKMRSTVPHVHLVSKRFKQEYDERCPISSELQIFVCYIERPQTFCNPDPVPPLAMRATSLRFHWIWCEEEPDSDKQCDKGESVVTLWRHYGRQIDAYVKALPHLKDFNLVISCGSLTCALAIAASSGASGFWGWIDGDPKVTLLRPVYDSEASEKSVCERYDEASRTDNPHSGPFFEDRETMATWSYEEGWKIDEEVVEKCRQEEAQWLSSRPPKGEVSLFNAVFARPILTSSSSDRVNRRRQRFQSQPKMSAILEARGETPRCRLTLFGGCQGRTGWTRSALFDTSVRFSIALVIPEQSCEIESVRFSSCTHIALSSCRFFQPSFLHCLTPVPPFEALRHIQTATLDNILSISSFLSPTRMFCFFSPTL